MKQRPEPAEVFHPGEYIAEEMLERGWCPGCLSLRSGMSVALIQSIIHQKRGVTPWTASLLSKAFGTSAELWVRLQATYDKGSK